MSSSSYYAISLWFVLAIFLLYTLGLLQHAGRLLSYPFSIDYVEWPEIARAWDLIQGQTLYPSWDELPLREANYTPIYTLVNAIGIAFTGPTPFFGRLIALLSTFGIMGTLAALLYPHSKKQLPVAILAAALYASSHMVWLWSGIVRVDNLAVLLSLFGLLAYTLRTKNPRWLWAAIVLCV